MTVLQILFSGLGGHSSVSFSLIEADILKKYNHVLIFYGIEDMPDSSVNKCRELGIEYHFVKKQPGLDVASQKAVIRILKKLKPGIILLHSVNLIVPVYYYSLVNKTRIITVEHQPNHLKTKREWVWSFLLMRLSKKVVYLTALYKTQMQKRLGFFFNTKKVSVINNGININLFKPFKSEMAGLDNIVKIGMLARLTNTKDHSTLIRAFKLLIQKENTGSELQLHIAGEGEMKAALLALTLELGLENAIHFRGMIPEAAAAGFLNELDIYVHASLGETMSTSIMQAMACGKPLIVSDVEGINNMIQDAITAILVPALDPVKLCAAMEKLINDKHQQEVLGKNALLHAQQAFSNHTMFNRYEQLFV